MMFVLTEINLLKQWQDKNSFSVDLDLCDHENIYYFRRPCRSGPFGWIIIWKFNLAISKKNRSESIRAFLQWLCTGVLRFSNKSDFVLQRWHSMKTYSCLFPLMFNLIRINFLLQFEFWDYFFYLVDKIVRTFFIINFSSCWSCEGFLFQIVPTFLSILF